MIPLLSPRRTAARIAAFIPERRRRWSGRRLSLLCSPQPFVFLHTHMQTHMVIPKRYAAPGGTIIHILMHFSGFFNVLFYNFHVGFPVLFSKFSGQSGVRADIAALRQALHSLFRPDVEDNAVAASDSLSISYSSATSSSYCFLSENWIHSSFPMVSRDIFFQNQLLGRSSSTETLPWIKTLESSFRSSAFRS